MESNVTGFPQEPIYNPILSQCTTYNSQDTKFPHGTAILGLWWSTNRLGTSYYKGTSGRTNERCSWLHVLQPYGACLALVRLLLQWPCLADISGAWRILKNRKRFGESNWGVHLHGPQSPNTHAFISKFCDIMLQLLFLLFSNNYPQKPPYLPLPSSFFLSPLDSLAQVLAMKERTMSKLLKSVLFNSAAIVFHMSCPIWNRAWHVIVTIYPVDDLQIISNCGEKREGVCVEHFLSVEAGHPIRRSLVYFIKCCRANLWFTVFAR